MQFLLLIHYWYRAIVWTCKRYFTAHIIRYTRIAIVNIINNCVIYSYWEKNIFFLLSPLYLFFCHFLPKKFKKQISLSILILKITSFNNSACTLQLILTILKPADLRYSAWFWVYVKKEIHFQEVDSVYLVITHVNQNPTVCCSQVQHIFEIFNISSFFENREIVKTDLFCVPKTSSIRRKQLKSNV